MQSQNKIKLGKKLFEFVVARDEAFDWNCLDKKIVNNFNESIL